MATNSESTRSPATSREIRLLPSRLDPLQPLAVVAAILGLGVVFAGPRAMRAVGMPITSKASWGLRMFGVRELVLALGLATAARNDSREQAILMADLVSAAQAGDMLLSASLLIRRELTVRAALAVWVGALPTLVMTRAAKRYARKR